MPLLTKVKLKNGESYELGKPWPVDDKEEGKRYGGFLIGLIRLCPSEGEQDEDGTLSLPAHYEVWCVPRSLIDNFFNPVQRALFKHDPRELAALVETQALVADDLAKFKIVHKRNVFLSQVAYDAEDWPTLEALTEVRQTVLDPTFGPDEDEGDDEPEPDEVQPQAVPANGEQKPAEPQAS